MMIENHMSRILLVILLFPSAIRCQCEPNWFGQNCSEPNICQYNNSSLCPQGFFCTTTDENQECLAVATFEGNSSSLIATFNHSSPFSITNELSFRLRARAQHSHVLTIKNLLDGNYMSIHISDRSLLYRESINVKDIPLIDVQLNSSLDLWSDFRFRWSSPSTLIINDFYTYSTNLTLKQLLTSDGNTQIFIGNGFRGCLDRVLIGRNFYVPFYKNFLLENDTRSNKFTVEQMENVQINNCTFTNLCENIDCNRQGHGRCEQDFDRGKCVCNRGWEGETCEININECARGNNCSIEHSICEDHADGYYTCKCQQGFTGQYCETNIDECLSSPCANGARCIDLINGYSCNCTDDYIGSNCSISIEETCLGRRHSCQNNGTCLVLTHDLYVDHPNTECRCPNGFAGQWCENDLCAKLYCQRNGTCQRMPEGKARCSCTEQWQGDECEHDVDECLLSSNLCKNNGSCFNYPGGYTCECSDYYLGTHCERKHICLQQSPCLNHGQCRPKGESFYCKCPSNYTGLRCELLTCEALPCRNNGSCRPNTDRGFICNCTGTGYDDEVCGTEIDECQSNPCFNNASCVNHIGRYSCLCPKSFAGRQCENKKFLGSLGFSYHYVIWPGVAVFLLLTIILLTVIIGRIRESRRSRGTYRPALNENGQSSRVEFSMILKPPPEERLI